MPQSLMSVIVVLSWLAVPVALICIVDDWLLRPRRLSAAPAPPHETPVLEDIQLSRGDRIVGISLLALPDEDCPGRQLSGGERGREALERRGGQFGEQRGRAQQRDLHDRDGRIGVQAEHSGAACGGGGASGGGGGGTNGAGKTLDVFVGANTQFPQQFAAWQQDIGNQFKQQTGATVKWETFASANDEVTKIETSAVSGTGPDIYGVGTTMTPTMATPSQPVRLRPPRCYAHYERIHMASRLDSDQRNCVTPGAAASALLLRRSGGLRRWPRSPG